MRNIIIVCEEKYRKYGDFLAQLVSVNDDTEDEIVGVKDGSVQAQVWTEKDYNGNAAQIASNQNILFIGNDKFVMEKSSTMPMIFSEYGMTCNSLGKQATLMITESVPKTMYNDFVSYASTYQKKIGMVINNNDNGKGNVVKVAGVAALSALSPLSPIVAYMVIGKFINKKIEAQQYMCAVAKFYLEYLANFMGM